MSRESIAWAIMRPWAGTWIIPAEIPGGCCTGWGPSALCRRLVRIDTATASCQILPDRRMSGLDFAHVSAITSTRFPCPRESLGIPPK